MVWLFHVNFLKIQVPALHYYYEIWKICATLKQQQPLKFIFPGPAASIPDYSLNFLVFVCHVLLYKILLPIFFSRSSFSFFSRKNCRKTLTQKGNQKVFPSVPPYFMSTLRMMMLNGCEMKNKIKKVFLTHITADHSTLCTIFAFLLHLFKVFKEAKGSLKRHVLGRAFNTHAEKEVDFQMYKL